MPIAGSANNVFQAAKAILVLVDPETQREPSELILRQAYALTQKEARVAISLAAGRDIEGQGPALYQHDGEEHHETRSTEGH
jgi:hypothetical protein